MVRIYIYIYTHIFIISFPIDGGMTIPNMAHMAHMAQLCQNGFTNKIFNHDGFDLVRAQHLNPPTRRWMEGWTHLQARLAQNVS